MATKAITLNFYSQALYVRNLTLFIYFKAS